FALNRALLLKWVWRFLDMPLRVRFPRIYALDSVKELDLVSMLDAVSLSSSSDRWYCDFNGDGAFRVKKVRSNLDDLFLPSSDVVTRWVRCDTAKCIFQRICRWWNLQWVDAQSFDDWLSWFKSVRMPCAPSSSTVLFRLLLIGVSIDVIVHFLGSSD
nr:RNA-directed DNA polymerase, eukaryota [Tanacetum cinerariifolium]